ncbi:MAG: acetamidase/formamidase family protein [Spirochaetales bacterium]|nr:acetamidase/formamidase family protein [Spirochaetales bacterium]
MIQYVDKTKHIYTMGPNNPPVLNADPGDTIVFTALDTYTDLLVDETCTREKDMVNVPINPVNGPVYINGAMPGDTLKIAILDIDVSAVRKGTMALNANELFFFTQFLEGQKTIKIPMNNGFADFFGNMIKLNPMIGILGIAPGEEISTMYPGVHGGNMDCKYLTKGTSLYLPVQIPGALLATADIHALQGDGEIVCGLEVPGIITLRVDLIKTKAESWPVLETDGRWYVIVSEDTIEKSCKQAVNTMVRFVMNRQSRYTVEQLIAMMAIYGDLEFCQVVDPLVTIRFGLDKSIITDLVF